MTLASFFHTYWEVGMMKAMANHRYENSEGGCGVSGAAKILHLVLVLAYLVYDASTIEAPGAGTTALIVLASLSEVFFIILECFVVIKADKIFPDFLAELESAKHQG